MHVPTFCQLRWSHRTLARVHERLQIERLAPEIAQRLTLLHGSLLYRDARLRGYDAAAVVEVIEHLDPPRLAAFEQVLFGDARPQTIVITTPNAEYNVRFPSLAAGSFRHVDHRFEWTRTELQEWASRVGAQYGYQVVLSTVGDADAELGGPGQLAVFQRECS